MLSRFRCYGSPDVRGCLNRKEESVFSCGRLALQNGDSPFQDRAGLLVGERGTVPVLLGRLRALALAVPVQEIGGGGEGGFLE